MIAKFIQRIILTVLALLGVMFIMGSAREVFGQTTGLMPVPKAQFFNSNGDTLANGWVCTYLAGTATPQVTYTDSTGGTPNADPLHLDSAGRGNIWLSATTGYKVLLYASGTGNTCNGQTVGTLIWSVDNVFGGLTSISAWKVAGTNISPITITNDVIVGGSAAPSTFGAGSGILASVGPGVHIFSGATANENDLNIRSTGGAITFDERIFGTATHVPFIWRNNGGESMRLTDGTLNIGTSGVKDGIITFNGVTSSGTVAMYLGGMRITSPTGALTLTSVGTSITVSLIGGGLKVLGTAGESFRFDTSTATNTVTVYSSSGTERGYLFGSSATMAMGLVEAGTTTASASLLTAAGCGVTRCLDVNISPIGDGFIVDANNSAVATNVWFFFNGNITRVLVGAVDSCTAGFRCLRIAN